MNADSVLELADRVRHRDVGNRRSRVLPLVLLQFDGRNPALELLELTISIVDLLVVVVVRPLSVHLPIMMMIATMLPCSCTTPDQPVREEQEVHESPLMAAILMIMIAQRKMDAREILMLDRRGDATGRLPQTTSNSHGR